LNGYTYDSYNSDVLQASIVKDGRITLPGGARYKLLILPGATRLSPTGNKLSQQSFNHLKRLTKDGAVILVNEPEKQVVELNGVERKLVLELRKANPKARIIEGPYLNNSFEDFGLQNDVIAINEKGNNAEGLVWTHRAEGDVDLYFISNQKDSLQTIELSLRITGKTPELWNALNGTVQTGIQWRMQKGRTIVPVRLQPNASLFVVLKKASSPVTKAGMQNWFDYRTVQTINSPWFVQFDTTLRGPAQKLKLEELIDWSKHNDSSVRYYSGTAVYTNSFGWKGNKTRESIFLSLGTVANIATVSLNGINCGTAWTYPCQVDITRALRPGRNILKIEVTNTWANRIIGDQRLPETKRLTWTTSPIKLEGKPLLQAGLIGPVEIQFVSKQQ
jgi:hypothetical protein